MNAVPPPIPRSTSWDRLPPWTVPVQFATLLGLLAALIALFFSSVASIGRPNVGMLDGLLGVLMLLTVAPLCGAGCTVLALALYRRPDYRVLAVAVLVIAVPLATPPVNLYLAKGFSVWNEGWWWPSEQIVGNATWPPESERESDRKRESAPTETTGTEAAVARHYERLTSRFESGPQRIERVYNGLIILDDGTVLSLYGIDRTVEVKYTLDLEKNDLVLNSKVVVRLPEDASFRHDYAPIRPGQGLSGFDLEAFARSPRDEFGWAYGAVPCLLYVDGRLYNSRFLKEVDASSLFRGYETPQPRGD